MYERALKIPVPAPRTFFLWGPRQVGKSSLLRYLFPEFPVIQLLKSEEFATFQAEPQQLRQRVSKNKWSFVVIDEIQKVPQLLDEVHFLIEEHGTVFALCGSSARKVRAGHANLLGGRALRFQLSGLVSKELGKSFDLERMINHGYLPAIYDSEDPAPLLRSYCADYLKEEIFAEGLVRKLQPFSRFLEAAAIGDTELTAFDSIARDCGVSAPTVKSYYQILCDTLLGRFLPAYTFRPKRRQIIGPKFYFADVGVVNQLSQRGLLKARSELFGKAFENWVHHELTCWLEYNQRSETLAFWRLTTGVEVDFIVGHMKCAIEAKASDRIRADHLKGLREVKNEYPTVGRRIVVSLEEHSRTLEDGIVILSVADFIDELWKGKIINN